MSRQPREIERRTRQVRCATCGAEPAEPCRTRTGRRARGSHAWRWYKAKAIGLFDQPTSRA